MLSYERKYLKYKNKYLIMKGGNQKYDLQWTVVKPELYKIIEQYYNNINFNFLETKMIKELEDGNAGGPVIRAHYPSIITNQELAKASIRGLKKLLSIKTIENAFNFKIKTFLSDRSLLTDLAWHSLMLKPHHYFMITNSILDKIKHILNDNIDYVIENVNKYIDTEQIIVPPKLIRHGTMSDTDFSFEDDEDDKIDIIYMIKKIYYRDKENTDLEWNLPDPELWTNFKITKKSDQ